LGLSLVLGARRLQLQAAGWAFAAIHFSGWRAAARKARENLAESSRKARENLAARGRATRVTSRLCPQTVMGSVICRISTTLRICVPVPKMRGQERFAHELAFQPRSPPIAAVAQLSRR